MDTQVYTNIKEEKCKCWDRNIGTSHIKKNIIMWNIIVDDGSALFTCDVEVHGNRQRRLGLMDSFQYLQ